MSIPLEVYRERRLVLVRFNRAISGTPTASEPDVDNRGFGAPEHCPIVGVMKDREIVVELERVRIDTAAKLFATVDKPDLVEITDPASGELPASDTTKIKLKAKGGTASVDPDKAYLEVRHGSATGPIIHRLGVFCYKGKSVALNPHLCTIKDATGASKASTADIPKIMALAKAIWAPCGITFNVAATKNETFTFSSPGVVPGTVAALNTVLGRTRQANAINIHFVFQFMDDPASPDTFGVGINQQNKTLVPGVTQTGVILAQQSRAGEVHDMATMAYDVAHEIGHILGLWHPNKKNDNARRQDTWCLRMLMHPQNPMIKRGNWKDSLGYGKDAGFPRRGVLLTIKDLAKITTDAECKTARGQANHPSTF
jgi:hypothetical protein